jgi:hypothetical protein
MANENSQALFLGHKRYEKGENAEQIIWVDMVDRNDISRFIFLEKNKVGKRTFEQSKGSRYPEAGPDCST